MRPRSRLHFLGASVIVCLGATAIFAQPERISIPLIPKPGQTVKQTMTQEMDLNATFDGAAAPATGPVKMKTTMRMTQKTGALGPDGSMEAETTYDQITTEMTMNGQSIPGAGNPLAGKTLILKYNRNGQVLDVKGLPDVGMTADVFKQMMSGFSVNLPTEPIAVGEAFNTPLNFSLPLPLPGNTPMNISGETRTTLVSLDRDASGRTARLDDIVAGSMAGDFASPDGKSSMKMDFTMSGNGTRVMDLDRGVVRSSTVTSVVSGRMNMGSAAPAPISSMRFEATTKITITTD